MGTNETLEKAYNKALPGLLERIREDYARTTMSEDELNEKMEDADKWIGPALRAGMVVHEQIIDAVRAGGDSYHGWKASKASLEVIRHMAVTMNLMANLYQTQMLSMARSDNQMDIVEFMTMIATIGAAPLPLDTNCFTGTKDAWKDAGADEFCQAVEDRLGNPELAQEITTMIRSLLNLMTDAMSVGLGMIEGESDTETATAQATITATVAAVIQQWTETIQEAARIGGRPSEEYMDQLHDPDVVLKFRRVSGADIERFERIRDQK